MLGILGIAKPKLSNTKSTMLDSERDTHKILLTLNKQH